MPADKKSNPFKILLVLTAASLAGVLALPSQSEAKLHFFLSASAGQLMQSEFPSHYRTAWLGTVKNLYEVNFTRQNSRIGAGFSIGFTTGTYADIDPAKSFDSFLYGAFIYHPGYSFPDAAETESRYIQALNPQGKYEESSAFPQWTQSERKAYVLGGVFGIVLFPLRNVPLGVDLSLGIAVAKQKFLSGFWKSYGRSLTLMGQTNSWDAWESYEKVLYNSAQGGWIVGDIAVPVGFGLRYFLGRSWSIDFQGRFIADRTRTVRGDTYIYSDASTDQSTKWSLSIGTVVSIGLTYIF